MRVSPLLRFRLARYVCIAILSIVALHASAQQVPFNFSNLNFNGFTVPEQGTSLKFGPDGRLYLAQLNGQIKIYTIQKTGANAYVVTSAEVLLDVQSIPNHDDIGTLAWDARSNRQVTGIVVKGTATQPIVYVSSSDPKWGGPQGAGGDRALDTNSGIITRLTKTQNGWEAVDLVRGLPRSEENHSTNEMEYVEIQGKPYLLITSGGNTNAGAPSRNFAWLTEYALSAAVLSLDLQALEGMPVLTDAQSGRKYIYDIPTLDDPSRPNVNGIYDPNDPAYNGIDVGDPFGGNDGLNMAKVVPGGPVQIFSGGYRNTYDLVVTENGRVYLTDNGPNQNWGGLPINEGSASGISNDYLSTEPGGNETTAIFTNGHPQYVTNQDQLIRITDNIQSYTFGSYYGGHPAPIRANPGQPYTLGAAFPFNPGGAGLYVRTLGDDRTPENTNGWVNISPLFTPNIKFRNEILAPVAPGQPGFDAYASNSLPVNWPPVPPSMANPAEADYIAPDLFNPNGPQPDVITILKRNSNAIDEYRSNAFQGAIKGTLVIGRANFLHFVHLKADGTMKFKEEDKFNLSGGNALGIYCMSDSEAFPGTIWVATFNNAVRILTPADANFCPSPEDLLFDPDADYDGDGFSNQDELDNGTEYCSGGSRPEDFDGDFESNLNDLDDDDDGILDSEDPFQLGSPNKLPISNELFSDKTDALGRPFGFRGLGLTGLMNNGSGRPNWLAWLDSVGHGPMPDDIYGGAAGAIQIAFGGGSANGLQNNQTKGFQFGALVDTLTGPFWISSNQLGLSGPQLFYDISHAGEIGIQMGDGSQSNFFKLVFTNTSLIGALEIEDVPDANPLVLPISTAQRPSSSENVVFMLLVDPVEGKVFPKVKIGERDTLHLGEKDLSGTVLRAVQSANHPLAIGIFGSSGVDTVEFLAAYDNFNVIGERPFILQPIPTVQRQAGSIPREINLPAFFGDNDGEPSLNYTVSVSGHPGLLASIVNRKLRLQFPLTAGEAEVTVRGMDAKGYFVEQEFLVRILEPESILYRINAGGTAVAGVNQAPNWQANGGSGAGNGFGYTVNSGTSLASSLNWESRSTDFPDYIDEVTFNGIFQLYRQAQAGQAMVYTIPINNGSYKVRLYWGIDNQSTELVGQRRMRVTVNGEVLENDLDIQAEFGKGVAAAKSYEVVIANGVLSLSFESLSGNAFVHAIEVIGQQVSPPIVITEVVGDQSSFVGQVLDGNLFVKAEGGQGALQYFAENLPPGIEIESVNGRIFGTIAEAALPNSPYWVTVKVRDSNAPYPNEEELSFQWTIEPAPVTLVGHWKMEESGGNVLTDHSGKGNDATVANTTGLSRVPGKEGLALRVTGNSFGVVPHSPDLAFSDAITIAAWIRPTGIGRRFIISKGSPDGVFLRTENNGKIEFRFNHTTNGTFYRIFSNQSYPTNGTWMHVAVTFNGTRTTMYINGIQDNTASYPATVIRPNTTNLQIGGWDGINRWIGDLDEVRLYSEALSAQEIFELVNGTLPAPQAPVLVGPDNGSSSSTVEEVPLVWESSALAEGYQLQISDGSDFDNLLVNSDLGNALSYLPESLPTDIPLFWRVRAYNGSGNSAWSQVRSFVKTEPVVVVDLVGHWKMDEGSGNVLLDHSGKGNNATVANTSGMSWVSGRENLALRVGGNNFGVVPHNASLEFSNALTVAAWIKPSGVGRRTIIAKGAPDGFFLRTENNGKIEFRFNHNTNGTQFRVFSNQSYPTNGTWMHVAVTFNGSSTTIYINGVQDNSASYAPTLIRPNTTNLQIAGWDGINRWIGDLDDVRLYNRALGAAEILQLAAGGNARMAAGPAKDKGGDPAQEAKDLAEGRQVESREVPLEPRLYPNPVLNKLQVEGLWIEEGNIEIQIWDMQGRMRLESAETVVQRSVLLDLNSLGLEPGVYVIAFKDKYQIQQFKFLKE